MRNALLDPSAAPSSFRTHSARCLSEPRGSECTWKSTCHGLSRLFDNHSYRHCHSMEPEKRAVPARRAKGVCGALGEEAGGRADALPPIFTKFILGSELVGLLPGLARHSIYRSHSHDDLSVIHFNKSIRLGTSARETAVDQ